MSEMSNLLSAIFWSIDIIEGDFARKGVHTNFILPHKLLTDKVGSGATVHHSRYWCASIVSLEDHVDFEMQTWRFSFGNNTGVNIVTGVWLCNTIWVFFWNTYTFRQPHGSFCVCLFQKSTLCHTMICSAKFFCCLTLCLEHKHLRRCCPHNVASPQHQNPSRQQLPSWLWRKLACLPWSSWIWRLPTNLPTHNQRIWTQSLCHCH